LSESYVRRLRSLARSNLDWLRSVPALTPIVGRSEQWARVVMNRETLALIEARGPENRKVLEISGIDWKDRCKFREYKDVWYPDFDICVHSLDERFDLIIAEQVFEHLPWPYRAGKHVYEMLNPGGLFLVTTPFLMRVHAYPTDCSRWTTTGLRYFLAECGFPIEKVEAFSWGNRRCVVGQFRRAVGYIPWKHSLANEPNVPVVVWALAQKD
jgi:SAM-dependent methyltransferase